MRLDKFLKVSRLIKRRTVANEMASLGRISVNGRVAKAGTDLKVGDVLDIHFGQGTTQIRVKELRETVRKEEAEDLYEIITGA